ncbi:hypothetical protein [Mucilaginibacter gilvus]|uniref:Uncharacterized protein n=1 Tax=Mucilaginibacter gilvus TaxID=2305909 RepID=A0A444MK02_9SPHI|nr:hypothetical protein [Mucilaginibacter gilvus]RWY49198.1 hypothetical protein EPL05_17445 [Mucilaginibacter gilvus]
MKKHALFLLCLFTTCFCGCKYIAMDYSNSMLTVRNNSSQKITVLYSNSQPPTRRENNVEFYVSDNNYVEPDSTNTIYISGKSDAWHYYISEGKEKKLFIYVFSVDEIKQYHGPVMNELINTNKYLKVLNYTEEELTALNWQITYNNEK